MEEKRYTRIESQQKKYYDDLQRCELLKEAGAKEDRVVYEAPKKINAIKRKAMLNEIWLYSDAGARITVNGRDLMPHEYSYAAYLLATGELKRDIIEGDKCRAKEYRLILNT